jgi:membrane-bound lytic murein transglycosylase B
MAENQVSRKERDFEWYKIHMGLDIKIQNARPFIDKYIKTLEQAEKKHGIHYELITAILGIETSYATSNRSLGNFIIFPALVSQYIFMPKRRNWAARELASLYKFSKKTNKPVYYFMGSFAGACGWAQFIPTSLLKYFIDTQDNDLNIDIYAVDDSIISIENYLFYHGLNIENIHDFNSRYYAVFKYNPSEAYAKAVLYIYDALRRN